MTTGVRVMREQCATCIFRPGNLMDLQPGRLKSMTDECRKGDRHIPCHEFLHLRRGGDVAGPQARGAVCRGYWDTQPHSSLLQVAERLGFVEYVDPNPSGPNR